MTDLAGEMAPIATLKSGRRLARSLAIFIWLSVVVALLALSLPTTRIFERTMVPELKRHAADLGEIISAEVGRAAAAGIPLDRLVDMQGFVQNTVGPYEQVRRVTLTDANGRTIYDSRFHLSQIMGADKQSVQSVSVPVVANGTMIGNTTVDIAADYLDSAISDLGIDVLLILLAAALVTFEVVTSLLANKIERPIAELDDLLSAQSRGFFQYSVQAQGLSSVVRCLAAANIAATRLNEQFRRIIGGSNEGSGDVDDGTRRRLIATLSRQLAQGGTIAIRRARSASDLRLPLFLFFLSTELPRAFLPVYADTLYQPFLDWQRSIVVALPMTAYVLASVISTPIGGSLVDRLGPRIAYLIGMLPTIASLIGEGLAPNIPVLAGFRVVEGFGFSLVSIAALDHIRQTTGERSRASGAVIYGAAYITAGICGSSIGGIIADRLGYSGAYIVATVLAIIATQMAISTLRRPEKAGVARQNRTSWAAGLQSMKSVRFVASAVLLAWPAQMAITGFVFYATPLLLHEEGFSTSIISRIVMAYFLTSLIVSRLAARWADKDGRHHIFAVVGLAVSGAAAFLPMAGSSAVWLVAAVAIIGLAQAIGGPSRGAIMLEQCATATGEANSSALGVYRVLERCGALAGPLFVAALVPFWGYRWGVAIMGATVLIATLVYLLLFRLTDRPDTSHAAGELT